MEQTLDFKEFLSSSKYKKVYVKDQSNLISPYSAYLITWSVGLMEKVAVIMAGGAGERLWPLSRESKPKQFVSVDGGKTLLAQTIERISELIPADNCFVITNKNYLDLARVTLKGILPVSNILVEPIRKNTAACISYATLLFEKKFGEGLVCFIPADSYVRNKDDYLNAISQAYQAAESGNDLIVIGVNPTYPATGYGYIQVNPEERTNPDGVLKVLRFKEKPSIEKAQEYVKSDNYLWNSGMVAGHLHVLVKGIRQFIPDHFEKISEALAHEEKAVFSSLIESAFNELNDISFDHGVLEKSGNLLAVKGVFDWSDIGSLDALSIVIDKAEGNNSVLGNHLCIDTTDSIIYSADKLVTTIGLNNMIIVDAGDSIIVCPKDRAQDVKSLVELLKKNGREKYT
jgi:mannose-1-phosphate guanylyltransferase